MVSPLMKNLRQTFYISPEISFCVTLYPLVLVLQTLAALASELSTIFSTHQMPCSDCVSSSSPRLETIADCIIFYLKQTMLICTKIDLHTDNRQMKAITSHPLTGWYFSSSCSDLLTMLQCYGED